MELKFPNPRLPKSASRSGSPISGDCHAPALKPTAKRGVMDQKLKFLKVAVWLIFLALTMPASSFGWPWSQTPEQEITSLISKDLNRNKQAIFAAFHPVGTAKKIEVHNVQLLRNGGNAVSIRFTIYWQGPITDDGFTKVQAVYDLEVNRWTSSQVLATNGVTNAQTNRAAFDIGWEIGKWLSQ